jgi:hypothetical protein
MKRAPIGTFFHSELRIGIDGCGTTFLCCAARPHKKTVVSRCDAKLAVHLGHADERAGAITPTPKAMRVRTKVAQVSVGMWIADEFPGFVGRQLRQIPDWTPPSRQACLHERFVHRRYSSGAL